MTLCDVHETPCEGAAVLDRPQVLTWRSGRTPGKRRGRLGIGAGETLDVWEVVGFEPGSTLLLTSAVHGCEYVGVMTIRRLYDVLEPRTLRGRVLMVPTANREGFLAGTREFPSDGVNLNAVFPLVGEPSTHGERVARAIERELYPEADFLLDLHGGDAKEDMEPLVFFPAAASAEVNARSREAARYLEVGLRIPSRARDGVYSHATQLGIPALLMEVGGLGRWDEGEVALELRSIASLMGHLGMGPEARPNLAQREALEAEYVSASSDGLWLPRVGVGDEVGAGRVLGVLERLDGDVLEVICARWDCRILYHTVALGVRSGDPLVAYARFDA